MRIIQNSRTRGLRGLGDTTSATALDTLLSALQLPISYDGARKNGTPNMAVVATGAEGALLMTPAIMGDGATPTRPFPLRCQSGELMVAVQKPDGTIGFACRDAEGGLAQPSMPGVPSLTTLALAGAAGLLGGFLLRGAMKRR